MITLHRHRLRHHLIFPLTNLCYTLISNTLHLWIYKLTPQLSTLVILILSRNLFLPIIFSMDCWHTIYRRVLYHSHSITPTLRIFFIVSFILFDSSILFSLVCTGYPSVSILHILPSCVAQQLSTFLPSQHQSYSASHSHNKCISYCFHLHPILSSFSWNEAYVSDKKILILHHFLHYQPFENNALSYFPAQYCSAVANLFIRHS